MDDFAQITYNIFPSVSNELLLDNIQTLDNLLTPASLFFLIKIILALILLVIATIYLHLAKKKAVFNQIKIIKALIDPLIAHIIIEDSTASIKMLQKLKSMLTNNITKRYVIDELINSKRNHSGEASEKIVLLYNQLELKKYSLKKIKKNRWWYIIARGIQELYMMEQRDSFQEIYQLTNNKNEFIRMEAQMGVIHLTGFKGLEFLESVSLPITDWQQLKLIEQLRLYPEKEDFSEKIPRWLSSNNFTVVEFTLRLMYEYNLYHLSALIQPCLLHPAQEVRSQAIKTFIQLETIETPNILLENFNLASYKDQLLILDAMPKLATEKEITKLATLLNHQDDTIKLKAAIAFAKCNKNGINLLKEKGQETPEPYQRIFQHIISIS